MTSRSSHRRSSRRATLTELNHQQTLDADTPLLRICACQSGDECRLMRKLPRALHNAMSQLCPEQTPPPDRADRFELHQPGGLRYASKMGPKTFGEASAPEIAQFNDLLSTGTRRRRSATCKYQLLILDDTDTRAIDLLVAVILARRIFDEVPVDHPHAVLELTICGIVSS